MVKLDTDAAVIRSLSPRLREALCEPLLGVVGSYDRTADRGKRDWSVRRRTIDRGDRPFAMAREQGRVQLWRAPRRSAAPPREHPRARRRRRRAASGQPARASASPCGGALSWPIEAAPKRSRAAHRWSCSPPAPARAGRCSAVPSRSRRVSGASPTWQPRASPPSRWRRRCSFHSRPSVPSAPHQPQARRALAGGTGKGHARVGVSGRTGPRCAGAPTPGLAACRRPGPDSTLAEPFVPLARSRRSITRSTSRRPPPPRR